jgi:hypothetical protein
MQSPIYSEISLNRPALGPIKMAGLEGVSNLQRNVRKRLKNRPTFKEGRFSEGPVLKSFTVYTFTEYTHW